MKDYIFGGNTNQTYADIQKAREIAKMFSGSATSVPDTAIEGVNAVADALIARRNTRKADRMQESMAQALGPDHPVIRALTGVPQYRNGTTFHPGGPAVVGEGGPELVYMPRGAMVAPNPADGGQPGAPNNIVRELLDMNAADQERAVRRMQGGLRPDEAMEPEGYSMEDLIGPQSSLQPANNFVGGDVRTAQSANVATDAAPVMADRIREELDKKFVPDYLEWTAGGRSADARKSVEQLREALAALESGKDNLTGPVVGKVPDWLGAAVNPDAIATRESVEEIVQRNLRLVLGAQFTEREGERLIARAYNKQLQEGENAKRVRRLLTSIEAAANAKDEAARYFQQNGTLVGWDGSLPSLENIEKSLDDNADDGGWQTINGVRIRVRN